MTTKPQPLPLLGNKPMSLDALLRVIDVGLTHYMKHGLKPHERRNVAVAHIVKIAQALGAYRSQFPQDMEYHSRAVDSIRKSIATFKGDPANTDFQRGYLSALRDLLTQVHAAETED